MAKKKALWNFCHANVWAHTSKLKEKKNKKQHLDIFFLPILLTTHHSQ